MHPDRLAGWQELIESCEDPLYRADLESQMQAEWWGTWNSPLDGYENRETWRRVLAPHIQPLPEAAD